MYCHSIFYVGWFISPTKPFECVMTNIISILSISLFVSSICNVRKLLGGNSSSSPIIQTYSIVRHLQANDVLYNQLENVLIHKNILMEKINWIEMIFFLYSIKMSSKYFFILNYFYISIYDIFPHRGLPYIPITWAFLDLKKII